MVNDRLNDLTWVHWCWDSAEGAPCCANQEEAAAKTAAATVNLFVSPGFEAGSLAIFTHTTDSLNKMIAGRVCKRILPRALQFGRQLVEHSDLARASADDLGSGLSDMAATHSIRKGRVAQWAIADRTQYILPGVKLVTAKLDAFEYALFGSSRRQRRPSVGVAARLTIKEIADPESSPITVILLDLWSMLSKWGPEPEGPWFLLPLCGVGDFDNQEMRHRLRKEAPRGNHPPSFPPPSIASLGLAGRRVGKGDLPGPLSNHRHRACMSSCGSRPGPTHISSAPRWLRNQPGVRGHQGHSNLAPKLSASFSPSQGFWRMHR